MKKVTKFFMAALLVGMFSFGYAQTEPDYKKAPKPNEKVLGTISLVTKERKDQSWRDQEVYILLLEKAKTEYPNRVVEIREMQKEENYRNEERKVFSHYGLAGNAIYDYEIIDYYKCNVVGKVVDLQDPEAQTNSNLSEALNKALRNVREGSRMAIDQVTVTSSMDRGDFKDQLIDILLDKGYRVVAKEYLEKLYEEQKGWNSGIYNENTTGKENNFSAVGYYINVKVTETSLRVQVVNVSTGEYEGNATVNF
ncbi:MAG: hypothetical protein IKH44_02250 [Bacteroidales bacterium]|nr:hypothetical protein [Bacteroidales bacterium]